MGKHICLAATFLIVAFIVMGCSGGGSPMVPALQDNIGPEEFSVQGQTAIAGLWQIGVDLQNGTIEAVKARQADLILNVLCFMEPPALTNLNLDFESLVVDFAEGTVGVDVIFTHPLTTPEHVFDGFDVRGIVFGPTLLNADGFTAVMNPADFEGVPFGYMDGLLGAPNSYADYDADYWPYKYFCDDLDTTTSLWDYYYNHPDIAAHRGVYSEGAVHSRHYDLSWAGLESPIDFLVFNYAVYANYNWPTGEPPFETDDYPITANSTEAFCMSYAIIDNSLTYYQDVGSGALCMEIRVWDWQGLGSTEVTIESIEPNVILPVTEGSFGPGSDPFDGIITFFNVPGEPTSTADVEVLITATDNSTTYGEAWFFGLLPDTHSFYSQPVESYWIMSVPVSDEPPCPTVEPVDIEAAPYNGTWFDDLTEDTACACEVENPGGTDLYWTHDQPSTSWNSGNTSGVYEADMDTTLIGPRILVPSTGAVKINFHLDLSTDGSVWDGMTLGYKLNNDPISKLGGTSSNVTDTYMAYKIASLTPGDEISWTINYHSDDVGDNAGTGCTLWDMTTTVFDPGPLPGVSDGGTPDPDNAICTDPGATLLSYWYHWEYPPGEHNLYHYFINPDFRYGAQSSLWSWTIGNSGYMNPEYDPPWVNVSLDRHRPCDPAETDDTLIPFGDWTITATAQTQWGSFFPEWGSDPAGDVYHMIKNNGTPSERLIIEYCDIGQIGEADTCRWRVILNGGSNANPYDMRIEWIDVGSHANEDADDHTAAWMVWNGVYIPIQCDYTAWADNTSVDIDQP